MNRKIIFYQNHFIEFYQNQDQKVKGKIQYVFELIKQVDRVPEKFLKHLTGTDGLYEIRVEYQSNIYRIFCCFDEDQLVVLFNGFQKKTRKTPGKEIEVMWSKMVLFSAKNWSIFGLPNERVISSAEEQLMSM